MKFKCLTRCCSTVENVDNVQIKCTLISPSSTNKEDTKLNPSEERAVNSFLRRASVRKRNIKLHKKHVSTGSNG